MRLQFRRFGPRLGIRMCALALLLLRADGRAQERPAWVGALEEKKSRLRQRSATRLRPQGHRKNLRAHRTVDRVVVEQRDVIHVQFLMTVDVGASGSNIAASGA